MQSLLSLPSTREKENKKMGEEILDLLSKPTAKERSLAERFRSQGGTNPNVLQIPSFSWISWYFRLKKKIK